MKPRPSRLAQLREDLNVALVLLVLGLVVGAFSFLPQSHTSSSSRPSPHPISATP